MELNILEITTKININSKFEYIEKVLYFLLAQNIGTEENTYNIENFKNKISAKNNAILSLSFKGKYFHYKPLNAKMRIIINEDCSDVNSYNEKWVHL